MKKLSLIMALMLIFTLAFAACTKTETTTSTTDAPDTGAPPEVTVTFRLDDIDRVPLGDIAETATTLLYPDMDFVWIYTVEDRSYTFDTREIKEALDGVPIDSPEIIAFLNSMLKENIESINGGLVL